MTSAVRIKRFLRVLPNRRVEAEDLLRNSNRVSWIRKFNVVEYGGSGDNNTEGEEERRRIHDLSDYKNANVFPMDAASVFCVEMLDVEEGHSVLDLCCAVGGKILAISELLNGNGILFGVDVAERRLDVTKQILIKYRDSLKFNDKKRRKNEEEEEEEEARENFFSIFQCDGTIFHPNNNTGVLKWSSTMEDLFFFDGKSNRKRANKSLRKKLNKIANEEVNTKKITCAFPQQFDRILIDAPCSTDGSVLRVALHSALPYKKKQKLGGNEFNEDDKIETLQLKLLRNGFHLLKKGGLLIYSTCSLNESENEQVVQSFLMEETTCKLVQTTLPDGCPAHYSYKKSPENNGLPLGVRFHPTETGETSGFFLCRLTKC